jgi:predicted small lipoprotein YifL
MMFFRNLLMLVVLASATAACGVRGDPEPPTQFTSR